MKKKIAIILSVLLLLSISVTLVIYNREKFANKEETEFCANRFLRQIDEIKKNYLKINGEEIEIFCTFKDKETAIQNIKKEASNALLKMEEVYKLEKFSDETWIYYRDNIENFIGKVSDDNIDPDIYNESFLLRSFFDIYENFLTNEEIKEYVKEASNKKIVLTNDEKFINMLPNYTKIVKEYRKNHQN